MIQGYLSQAAVWTEAQFYGHEVQFTGICTDSRSVTKGSLFVSLPGANHDGHDYLAEAEAHGACAAVVNHLVTSNLPQLVVDDPKKALARLAAAWRRQFDLPVIAVLGSNGKTTVKEMITAILKQRYGSAAVLSTQGNQNNMLGVSLNIARLNTRHQIAVLELGADKQGEITELSAIVQANWVVISNAGLDHIEGFGGVEASARANGEIFSDINNPGLAVLNGDDACLPIWLGQAGKIRCITFGFNSGLDVRGVWNSSSEGGELGITSAWGQVGCKLNLLGMHNASNALAAASICMALGIDLETVATGLESVKPVAGRLNVIETRNGSRLIDDTYNANPSSLTAALDTLSAMPGKKILVLGDMAELGDGAQNWHEWAGQAARLAGISELFGLGFFTRFATESFGEAGYFFDDSQLLLKALGPKLVAGVVILVKGSRCMHLESIVQQIEKA